MWIGSTCQPDCASSLLNQVFHDASDLTSIPTMKFAYLTEVKHEDESITWLIQINGVFLESSRDILEYKQDIEQLALTQNIHLVFDLCDTKLTLLGYNFLIWIRQKLRKHSVSLLVPPGPVLDFLERQQARSIFEIQSPEPGQYHY